MPVVPQDFSNAFAVSTIFEVEMRCLRVGFHMPLQQCCGSTSNGRISNFGIPGITHEFNAAKWSSSRCSTSLLQCDCMTFLTTAGSDRLLHTFAAVLRHHKQWTNQQFRYFQASHMSSVETRAERVLLESAWIRQEAS